MFVYSLFYLFIYLFIYFLLILLTYPFFFPSPVPLPPFLSPRPGVAGPSALLCEDAAGAGGEQAGGAAASSVCWLSGEHVEGTRWGGDQEEEATLGG